MKKSLLRLLMPALVGFLLTAPAGFAATERSERSERADRSGAASANADTQASDQDQDQVQLTGKVINQREVAVSGGQGPNKIVLMETQDGQRLAVDLGPASKLQGTDFKTGSPISLSGTVVEISGQPVFMATRLDLNGKNLNIDRPLPQQLPEQVSQGSQTGQAGQTGPSGQGQQERTYQMSGTILNEQEVDVRGGAKSRVVMIKTDQGKRVLTDLGPASGLQSLNLKKGDRIEVSGHGARTGERAAILFADTIRAGNRTVNVQRPMGEERRGNQDHQGAGSRGSEGRQPEGRHHAPKSQGQGGMSGM